MTRHECRYIGCEMFDDENPLCTDYNGRMNEGDGKRAECYKQLSPFYRIVRFLRRPFRSLAEGLSSRVAEGLESMEGIDDD